MFGSLGFGELLLILIVALIVFGPHRLPEIARRAGDLMSRARDATRDFTDAIDAEYEGESKPLRDLRGEYEATRQQLSDTASKLTDMTTFEPVEGDQPRSDTDDEGRERPESAS
jgi:Tat protein translocase TatB subunit